MRYRHPVKFIKEDTKYNPNTGNHDTVDIVTDERLANVTYQSEERMSLAYGGIKHNSLTIRMLGYYDKPYDFVQVDGVQYQVDSQRKIRHNHILQVSKS